MNSSLRSIFVQLLFAAAFVAAAGAQDTASGILDRGRLVTFRGDTPIATERFQYERHGDSLVVVASTERRWRQQGGAEQRYAKHMVLCARADDFGMLSYTSSELVDGQTILRTVQPNDTMLTVNTEVKGGRGSADYIERPPGRFFALDRGLYTLFDVIGRNLQHRIFGSRPVQLVLVGENSRSFEATATLAGPDTVDWGGRRVVTERIALRDSLSAFTMWLSPEGHMLRLQSEDGRLVVMREPPDAPAPAKRSRPRGK